MPDSLHVPTRWTHSPSSQDAAEAMANAAGAVEIAASAAVGLAAVRALTRAVRGQPLLSLLFAAGVGYLLGKRRQSIRRGGSKAGHGRVEFGASDER